MSEEKIYVKPTEERHELISSVLEERRWCNDNGMDISISDNLLTNEENKLFEEGNLYQNIKGDCVVEKWTNTFKDKTNNEVVSYTFLEAYKLEPSLISTM